MLSVFGPVEMKQLAIVIGVGFGVFLILLFSVLRRRVIESLKKGHETGERHGKSKRPDDSNNDDDGRK